MRLGAWLWGLGLLLAVIASGTGWLVRVPAILVTVPAALFAIGAGAFCIGRPGLVTSNRIWSCVFAALLSLVAATNLPLRAAFFVSRNDIESSAKQAQNGSLHNSHGAGCFALESCQISPDGSVCLWTEDSGKERIGFIKSTAPKVVGAVQEIDLGDGWRYALVRAE